MNYELTAYRKQANQSKCVVVSCEQGYLKEHEAHGPYGRATAKPRLHDAAHQRLNLETQHGTQEDRADVECVNDAAHSLAFFMVGTSPDCCRLIERLQKPFPIWQSWRDRGRHFFTCQFLNGPPRGQIKC